MKKTALSYQYSEQHIQQYVISIQYKTVCRHTTMATHTTVCHHTTMNYMSTTQTQLYVI